MDGWLHTPALYKPFLNQGCLHRGITLKTLSLSQAEF